MIKKFHISYFNNINLNSIYSKIIVFYQNPLHLLNNISFSSNKEKKENNKNIIEDKNKSGGGGDEAQQYPNYQKRQYIGLLLGPLLFLLMLLIDRPAGMTVEAQKVAAVGILMAVWWICESIPIPATSLLPLALMPILGVSSTKKAALPYASDIIFLYMGGFFIALAMQKWNLHKRIAMNIIKIVGFSPSRIILGFMLATAAISAFVSNTATAVMMLPIGLAVITHAIDEGKKAGLDKEIDFTQGKFNFALNLMLGISYAASIGGVATLIGTPPNAILSGYLATTYNYSISFSKWVIVGVPLVIIMLPIAWIVILKTNPMKLKKIPGGKDIIKKELAEMGKMSKGEIYTLIVFSLTGLTWVFSTLLKKLVINSEIFADATIAMMGGLILFLIPIDLKKNIFVLDWPQARRLPWGVLLLFGGGLSLAEAFQTSQLAEWMGRQIELLHTAPLIILILIAVTLVKFITEMTSNTATAALMMPILTSIAIGIGQDPLLLLVPSTFAVSCAFMLPVGTPPNAIVFGSGFVTIPQMAKTGLWLNIVTVLIALLAVYFLIIPVFDINLNSIPLWVK